MYLQTSFFHILDGHFACVHLIDLFFLEGREKAFHAAAVVALPDIAHALNYVKLPQEFSWRLRLCTGFPRHCGR